LRIFLHTRVTLPTEQQQQQVPTGHSAITRKGYSPDPSHKPYNQDAMVVERDDVSGAFLFCVFDGHGEFGHRVSKYFESRIAQEIFAHPDFPVRSIRALPFTHTIYSLIKSHTPTHIRTQVRIDVAMCESVLRLERLMLRSGSFDCSLSGTTGVLAIVRSSSSSSVFCLIHITQVFKQNRYSTVSSPSQTSGTHVSSQWKARTTLM